MNVGVIGPGYCDYQLCTVVDGLQSLGHDVYDLNSQDAYPPVVEPKNYMTMSPRDVDRPDVFYNFFLVADTNNPNACNWSSPGLKVIVHGHDRWTDYISVPNSPVKPINWSAWNCDIAFVRDLDRGQFEGCSFPVYPMEFATERRFVEASLAELAEKSAFTYTPWNERKFQVAFFGTQSTARRDRVLDLLRGRFKCNFGDSHAFTQPDDKWSKWVNGRYTHAPLYYKALANAVFALSPLGAGPSCGRTYEGYAAGCIPLIQRYPKGIEQIVPFTDGENCILWDTPEELIDKMTDYSSRPSDLDELQVKCINFSTEHLLSKHRAQFILDKMKEHGLL